MNSVGGRFLVKVSSDDGMNRKESNNVMCSYTGLSTPFLSGRILIRTPFSTAMNFSSAGYD